ncbi:unnamed protein product [Rotaria sp. Silwood1]|nr:unnamed protein product [Rotaria sp. Silwood1]
MTTPPKLLATIQANLKQAMERKKPREQTVKFELDGQVRACCLAKPFNYSDLIKSIENLFGNHTLISIDKILCLFSRDDALRLPITNDDDLNKVIAIAETNQATKLNFLLIRKNGFSPSQLKTKENPYDSGSISDDGQPTEVNDTSLDSPPPGTIATQKRRTTKNITSKSSIPKDGGLFIPESVSIAITLFKSSSFVIGKRRASSRENKHRILSIDINEVKILECEINIYKQLNHERIVRYHGAVRTEDYLQIFMEYMTGGSVREQILNYGALTEQLTKKYTKQILEGLIYLHKNRFIHRDIKCANILRDISGNIKLADFGTSRRLIAITNQNQPDSGTIGTAHWTAPEIIQGSIFGRKADIWSLGCTVVEMLTTGPPWQNLQPIAAIFHIATCDKPQYQLPDNVSSSAREFIDTCLTKDYHQRPTAEDLINHAFLSDVYNHNHHHHHEQNCNQTSTNLTQISF